MGHVKATVVRSLAPLMDAGERLGLRVEGTIPRGGNNWTVSDW